MPSGRPGAQTGRQGNGTPIDPEDVISPGDVGHADTGRQRNGSQPGVDGRGPQLSARLDRAAGSTADAPARPVVEAVEELLDVLGDINIEELLDKVRELAGRQKNGHRHSDPAA